MSGVALGDHAAMERELRALAGRRFLGTVDGDDCLELVFEDLGAGYPNLVSIFTRGRRAGVVAFGGVSDPELYVRQDGTWPIERP